MTKKAHHGMIEWLDDNNLPHFWWDKLDKIKNLKNNNKMTNTITHL